MTVKFMHEKSKFRAMNDKKSRREGNLKKKKKRLDVRIKQHIPSHIRTNTLNYSAVSRNQNPLLVIYWTIRISQSLIIPLCFLSWRLQAKNFIYQYLKTF